MGNEHVEQAVLSICNRGCQYVNSVLADDDIRTNCKELVALPSSDQDAVLEELKSVMSVYDQTGSCEV